jgi:hypothetical protein
MMDDQKILDNNPVGFYTNVSMSNGKPFIWTCNNFRSLADIKELVELRNANAELKKDNAHLKKEVDKHRAGFVACMTGEQFTIHNLKQEAKGIELLIREETSVGRLHNGDKRSFIFCQDAKIRALELLGKAKSLKAGN